jgi:hypothetical protein
MRDLKHPKSLQTHSDMSQNLSSDIIRDREMAEHLEQARIDLATKTFDFPSRVEKLMVLAALIERVTPLQKHSHSLSVFHDLP